ncbi:hypothetical protein [Cohaesibacter celericrescens]|uniref:Curlin n=1 Tax=Cohaesibacter celericrescens TaxID=2067669 RepID=A0A2N5XSX0_9HYPH|nr:hypothetical protein [Cohaesibacter celericrescens]PLW77547.1 hypothetical protein C0081_09540 [Cohaesibacter celericrescens]
MKKIGLSSLGTVLLMLGTCGSALADDNSVYIGQTGFTNSVSIDQLGESNKIGSDDISIFVSQDGSGNALTVSQTGYTNEAGATSSAGALGLLGLYQSGDNGVINITQKNTALSGLNIIGAVSQSAPTNVSAATSNSLTILQTDDALGGTTNTGNGEGNHVIGEIQQIQTGTGANIASISQYDGASGGGGGNRVQLLIQEGSANQATLTQQDSGNTIGDFRQYGTNNQTTAIQRDGTDNVIDSFQQDGEANRALLSMTGSRNVLFSIIQRNALLGVAGNILTVTMGGDDNGGDGMGGLGQFQFAATKLLQVAQAQIQQLGDENHLNFVTSAVASTNRFGFVQDGDGNALSGTVDGTENEAAVLQIGDGNRLDFTQSGDKNAIAISYRGDDNVLNVEQSGDENAIEVTFDGAINPITRSNQNNDPALGGFTDLVLAHAGSLMPGVALQSGNLNTAKISISAGNFNKFAFSQTGDQNIINGAVTGNSNQALVVQTNAMNTAYYRQSGNNNQLIILQ